MVKQSGKAVFEQVQETCKQLQAEIYEIDENHYSILAKAKTTWKTFGHKFQITLEKNNTGTVVELYYNFVGMRGGPYKDYMEKFLKIFEKRISLQSGIKYDVVNLKLANSEKKLVQENAPRSKLCNECSSKILLTISFVLLSVLITNIILPSVYANGNSVSVTSDKSQYARGDSIVISGTVNVIVQGTPATIQIYDPNGDLIWIVQKDVDQYGKYIATVKITDSWQVYGRYQVIVQYGPPSYTGKTFFDFNTPDKSYTGKNPQVILAPSNTVAFRDHSGYIPSWAQFMGPSQASSICTSPDIKYGTDDSKWCGEFLGYRVDQLSGQSNTSDNPNNSPQVNIQYHKEDLFLTSSDLGKSNSFQDSQNRFSINIPASWVVQPNLSDIESLSNGAITYVGSFKTGDAPDMTYFDIERTEGLLTNNNKWDSSWTDEQLQKIVTTMSLTKNLTEINIDHYPDVVKISVVGTEPIGSHTFYKKNIFFLIQNTNIEYEIHYSALSQIVYDKYISEADKAVDSMYIYEIPKIVPEFGSIAGIIITISVIGSLVISKRFSKV